MPDSFIKYAVALARVLSAVLFTGFLCNELQAAGTDSLYSVSYTNTSLDAVLLDLVEKTDIDLVYYPGITAGKRITIEMAESPAEAILEAVVGQAGLRFHRLESGTYVINRRVPEPPPPPPPPPAAVQGNVLDAETGMPAASVRIISAGRLPAVVTDSSGFFRYDSVKAGVHLLVAQKKGFSFAFQKVEVVPGRTANVQMLLTAETVPDELSEMPGTDNLPVFTTVIDGSYPQNPVVFPEWNGTHHEAWPATLPGIVTLKPVTGYHSISFWSPADPGSGQGLFLFTGRLQTDITGAFRNGYRYAAKMNTFEEKDFDVADDDQVGFRTVVEASDTFLEAGISAGHLRLKNGVLRAGVNMRIINPVTSSNSRMINDLTRWLYTETETALSAPVVDKSRQSMEAGLLESGINLDYKGNTRVATGLSVYTGHSYLDVNRLDGTFLLVPLSDRFENRYTVVSQFIRYSAGSQGTFFQRMNYHYSGLQHQIIANRIAEQYNGSYTRSEFKVEAGYSGQLSKIAGFRASYLFDRASYEADFTSGLIGGVNGDDDRLTDHRLNVDVTLNFDSGLTVTPKIGILQSNIAGALVLDPGISIKYSMTVNDEKPITILAGWHQVSNFRHRFKLPVPFSSTPVPFYDVTLAPRDGDKPVVVSFSYLEASYKLSNRLQFRVFARYGTQKQLQRPDFLTGSTGTSVMPGHEAHLTDSREYRLGGVIYGYGNRTGLEAGLSYSYGKFTEKSTSFFSGKRVQAAENVPHQVKLLANWPAGKDFRLEARWESGFGKMTRALHGKYYQYRYEPGDVPVSISNPESSEHRREPWHRLDAGIVKKQKISGVELLIKLQFMNILNRKNHLDTVIVTDLNSPEPQFSYLKRRMPGFYPQISLKAEF
ncbi:MAG: carboxypeptidase regulatory-like domain-containing protein [Cyclonatronaceae bacterium]